MTDSPTRPNALRVIAALVIRAPFDAEILPRFTQAFAAPTIHWRPTSLALEEIKAGLSGDVVIVTETAMDELSQLGLIAPASRVSLLSSQVGVAVKRGAPQPDLHDTHSFVEALLAARSVAYSRTGASGIYFEKLIAQLGIAQPILQRATVLPEGFTAKALITGEADLAIQQISELMVVDGVDIVGPLPPPIQSVTTFSAAIFKQASHPDLAVQFLAHLRSTHAQAAYRRAGLMPVE